MACAATLAACGQKGPLFMPSSPAASTRATLPQTLGIASQPAPGPATAAEPELPAPNAAPAGARDASGRRTE